MLLEGQNIRTDYTSGRQNVRGDKTSGDTTSMGKKRLWCKTPWGPNVRRHNVRLGYILNDHSRQYLLKNLLSMKKRL
jgi:hypothetical protein